MGTFDTVVDVPLVCTNCGLEAFWEVQFKCPESWQRTVRIGEVFPVSKQATQNPFVTLAFGGYVSTPCSHCRVDPEQEVEVIVRESRVVCVRPDAGNVDFGVDAPVVLNEQMVRDPDAMQ